MGVCQLLHKDFDPFLSLAAAEGWVSDCIELEFLLANFPSGCLVWMEKGTPIGFITAIRYDRSGWIGNLIVHPDQRGKGIGGLLMKNVLDVFDRSGAETIWLTASEAGAPLYGKLGFRTMDTIVRWQGSGTSAIPLDSACNGVIVNDIDRDGWGDFRGAALKNMEQIFTEADGFLARRALAGGVQIGPFGSRSARTAARLLERSLQGSGVARPVFLDVPDRNSYAAEMLQSSGFRRIGSNLLMYRGMKPEYDPTLIYALASMGSFG